MSLSKNHIYRLWIGLFALAAVFFAPVAVFAQETGAAQAAPQANQNWYKVCSQEPNLQKNVCLTTQEFRTKAGQVVASVAIREIEGEEQKNFIIAVPLGMQLRPGLLLQVDDNQQIEVQYTICFQNACYADVKVDAAFVDQLKRGSQLAIIARNQQAKAIKIPLTLIGFTKTYEGEPIDTAVLQEQQQKLREELQKKAEEARQKLIEEQQNATSSAE